MRQRLPLILSATALLVSLFGATPLGNAAEQAIRKVPPFATKAGYANKAGVAVNATKLNGHKSSANPVAGNIPVLGSDGKLPASIGAVGSPGPPGPKGANGATNVVVRAGTPVSVPIGANGDAFAECMPGEHLTGGGGETTNADPSTLGVMVASEPNPNNASSWFIRISNFSSDPLTIQARAVCASP